MECGIQRRRSGSARGRGRMLRTFLLIAVGLISAPPSSHSIEITIDYRFDTNSFFDPATANGRDARDALQAAADRFSAVISSSLSAVHAVDDDLDVRIGFTSPGTGQFQELSSATSETTDAIVAAGGSPADYYLGELDLEADEWWLFAGARPLPTAAIGGTGTGTNFRPVFEQSDSLLNRGLRETGSVANLPLWGGVITFDNSARSNWHFDASIAPAIGATDFYSIALHEIGHALGLATGWTEWETDVVDEQFTGSEAVAAYNRDNDSMVTRLELEGNGNSHWKENAYDSRIFSAGNPNTVGTVGLDDLQDLIMEPIANFTDVLRRFELTNVDVAALRDVGWETIEQDAFACDWDGDADCDIADLDQLFLQIAAGNATLSDRDEWLLEASRLAQHESDFLLGDVNLDGIVNANDLNVVGRNWGKETGLWSEGDFDASGYTDAADLNKVGIHWQSSSLAPQNAVPEPSNGAVVLVSIMILWHSLSRPQLSRRCEKRE